MLSIENIKILQNIFLKEYKIVTAKKTVCDIYILSICIVAKFA